MLGRMVRQVTRVLRATAFAAGVALLAAIPGTRLLEAVVVFQCDDYEVWVMPRHSAVCLFAIHHPVGATYLVRATVERRRFRVTYPLSRHLLPTVERDTPDMYVSIPLWLPAAVCLAWPVTSFLLARRTRRRGFPVECVGPSSGSGSGSGPAAR